VDASASAGHFGCSISSAQIEPNAGKWKTWVLTSGDQMRLPPPPDEAETRAEIAQLKALAKQRDAATLDRIIWWNAGPPGYRWTSIAIPPGPANASLHSRIMAHDGSDRTGPVDIPPGPCRWTGINPIAPFAGTRKTWVLSSASQLRPGPPPDCRSPEGQAELAEVRNYPRTFESNATAFYWQSGRSNWNNVIDQKIYEYRLDVNPPRAARVYALASIAGYDATVACWDAKYTFWAIRPFMLGVTPLFPTPNHPSYPAAHGCLSGAISATLAYLFPHDAVALNALGTEAGESRLWAGIHFRSDIDTGLALGRAVAKLVIEQAEKDGSQSRQ